MRRLRELIVQEFLKPIQITHLTPLASRLQAAQMCQTASRKSGVCKLPNQPLIDHSSFP